MVSVGQEVDVKVKSVEKDSERISLSIKDTLPTPFENIKGKFHENDVIEGKVIRLANFGAFVEIALVFKDLYTFQKLLINILVHQVKC